MSVWKDFKLRCKAALVKGTAKDIDKAQEVVNDSDNPEVIVDSIESGRIKLRVPEKRNKKKRDSDFIE